MYFIGVAIKNYLSIYLQQFRSLDMSCGAIMLLWNSSLCMVKLKTIRLTEDHLSIQDFKINQSCQQMHQKNTGSDTKGIPTDCQTNYLRTLRWWPCSRQHSNHYEEEDFNVKRRSCVIGLLVLNKNKSAQVHLCVSFIGIYQTVRGLGIIESLVGCRETRLRQNSA